MSRKEKREMEEKTRKVKEPKGTFQKFVKLVKLVLFITMLIFTFLVSDKIANFIINLGIERLTRIVNMILITVVTGIYFYKK